MTPWMESKVLNHEKGLYPEMIADRIRGDGGGSAAESPCDETAKKQKKHSVNCVLPLSMTSKMGTTSEHVTMILCVGEQWDGGGRLVG